MSTRYLDPFEMMAASNNHVPESGRMVIRHFDKPGPVAIAGLLHLPLTFTPKEGPAYMVRIEGERISVCSVPLDDGLPEDVQGQGIGAALKANCWPGTPRGTMAVRFVQAFPDSNGWSVYGLSRDIDFSQYLWSKTGHTWFDIKKGRKGWIAAPGVDTGIQVSQLLTTMAVWPDANGVPHQLPEHDSVWRHKYHEYTMLRARYGATEITKDELDAAAHNDPMISAILSFNDDSEYLKFLVKMREAGRLVVSAPMSASDVAVFEADVSRIVASLLESEEVELGPPRASRRPLKG